MGCAWSSADLTGDGLRIHVMKEIARGGFSQVFLAEDVDSREKYAIKKILISQKEEEKKVHFEAEQHRALSAKSPNIVPLLALIDYDSSLHLVFPFYIRGNVAEFLAMRRKTNDYVPQAQVLKLALDTCSALRVVHSADVAHRDLKTANLMLDDNWKALLMDFGSAVEIPIEVIDAKMRQRMIDDCAEHCSMPYRAPELFSCDIGTKIDENTDIWSLGCCLYAFCYFVSPFDIAYEKGDSVALAAQSPHRINYPSEAPYDKQLVQIIKQILKVEPTERMPLEAIVEALEKIKGTTSNGNVQILEKCRV